MFYTFVLHHKQKTNHNKLKFSELRLVFKVELVGIEPTSE